jgi:plasmid replication initiation protein
MNEHTPIKNSPMIITSSVKALGLTFKQSHEFLFSSQDFTSVEELIFSLVCSKSSIMEHSTDDNHFLFTHDLLCQIFNTQRKNLYGLLTIPCSSLLKMQRHFLEPDSNTFRLVNIFKEVALTDKGLIVVPSPQFVNEVFSLENGFAEIDHKGFWEIRNNRNAMRLYRILSRFKNDQKLFPVSIEKLKTMFGVYDQQGNVLKHSYTKTSIFLARVINPAIELIRNSKVTNSNLIFHPCTERHGYEVIKKGRAISQVQFHYHWEQIESSVMADGADFNFTVKEAYERANELRLIKRNRSLELNELIELQACYKTHNLLAQAEVLDVQILELQDSIEEENKGTMFDLSSFDDELLNL